MILLVNGEPLGGKGLRLECHIGLCGRAIKNISIESESFWIFKKILTYWPEL